LVLEVPVLAFLLATAAVAQGPYGFQSVAEFQETSRAGALDVAAPVISCVRQRVEAHQLSAVETGKAEKARAFAIEQFDACGWDDARTRLTATLAKRLPTSSKEAERRADAYLRFVGDVLMVKAAEHFKVAPVIRPTQPN
jgi:hypothetical protein